MTAHTTLYMEDILAALNRCAKNFSPLATVTTIADLHIQQEYTEKQRNLIIKLCQKYIKQLNIYFNFDISSHIDNPKFRSPLKILELKKKKLSVSSHEKWGKVALLEFPFDQDLVDEIRSSKSYEFFIAEWIPSYKAWLVALNEYSIAKLKSIIKDKNFQVDEEFEKYSAQYDLIVNNIGEIAPMLSIKDGVPFIKNKCEYTPDLKATDMLSALFEARSLGISIWSEEYDDFLNSSKVNPVVSTFIKHPTGVKFNLDFQKTPLIEIKDIIQYLGKILIVMTNNSLLKNFEMTYRCLTDMGIQNSEISVMFRLSNSNNSSRQFNELVKEYRLNNPISESTKIVIVNDKITKPILKSQIHFNGAIVMRGLEHPYYGVDHYTKSLQNYICYGYQRSNKDLSFVNL